MLPVIDVRSYFSYLMCMYFCMGINLSAESYDLLGGLKW